MRKLLKARAKCLLVLGTIAILVMLYLQPRLQETHITPSALPPPVHLPYPYQNEDKKEGSPKTVTSYGLLKKSPTENPALKDLVEVKRITPKFRTKEESEDLRRKGGVVQADPMRSFKIVGFSPKELQDRALTFPQDSPLRVFLKEQARRVEHVSSTCRAFQSSLTEVVPGNPGPPVGLPTGKRIIYDRQNQLTFCRVYKAASSTWSWILLQLAGVRLQNKGADQMVNKFYPELSSLSAAKVTTTNTTYFMMVRNPLGRLLSCYLEKFQNAHKNNFYYKYGVDMIKRYRKKLAGYSAVQIKAMEQEVSSAIRRGGPINFPNNPFGNPLGPTFPEFVEFIINTKHVDHHWQTYTSNCIPCTLTCDFILRYESFEEETRLFLEYLNRTGEVALLHANRNPIGDTKTLSCEYYGQLSLLQIDKLKEKYKKDLLLYEYDVQEYRKCAKDYAASVKNGAVDTGEGQGGSDDGGGGGGYVRSPNK